jgi:hypothetical protein
VILKLFVIVNCVYTTTACVQLLCTHAQACGKSSGANGVLGYEAVWVINIYQNKTKIPCHVDRMPKNSCLKTGPRDFGRLVVEPTPNGYQTYVH